MKTEHDQKITRCPKLGDEITFAYCLKEAGDLPCFRIILCWQAAFDAASVLKETLTHEQWERLIHARPKNKMESLLDLIQQAQKRL
jgi:hypothetical protein